MPSFHAVAAALLLSTSAVANPLRFLSERQTTDDPDHVRIAYCGDDVAAFYYKQDPLDTSNKMGEIIESSVRKSSLPTLIISPSDILKGITKKGAGVDTALSGSFDMLSAERARSDIKQEKTTDAFLGTLKYGRTGLNCFRTEEFEFAYKPGSDKKKDHAFDSEKKCKSTVLCNRAEGIAIDLTASKDVVIVDRYKEDEGKPSKLLNYAKELIHDNGSMCKPGEDVGVNTGSTCKLKATECTNSGKKQMLEKIIDAFGNIADEKGAYKRSSQKNTYCSGYGYCPSSMDVSYLTFPKQWHALVKNIPPPGSGSQPSTQAELMLEFECKSEMDETLCKVIEGLTGAGALIPKVGTAFDVAGLAAGFACA